MCKGNGRGKWREKAEVAMGNGHAGNADGHRVMGNGHWDSQMEGGRVRTAEVATLAAGLLSLDRPDWRLTFGPILIFTFTLTSLSLSLPFLLVQEFSMQCTNWAGFLLRFLFWAHILN